MNIEEESQETATMQVRCPSCKNEFLISASSCWNRIECESCGKQFIASPDQGNARKNNKNERKRLWLHCTLLFFVVGFLMWGLVSCLGSCSENANKIRQQELVEGDIVKAKILLREKISSILKAPSTAKITFTSESGSSGKFSFSGYIDAQNSFGAMIRNYFSAEVEYNRDLGYRVGRLNMK